MRFAAGQLFGESADRLSLYRASTICIAILLLYATGIIIVLSFTAINDCHHYDHHYYYRWHISITAPTIIMFFYCYYCCCHRCLHYRCGYYCYYMAIATNTIIITTANYY